METLFFGEKTRIRDRASDKFYAVIQSIAFDVVVGRVTKRHSQESSLSGFVRP